MFRLEGKVAIITGGASGIGECTAKLFAKHGAKVVIADIQDDLGQSICKELGPSATFVHCDVTNEAHVENAVDYTMAQYGKLDIMHNNAGIGGPPKPNITNTALSEFEKVINVNLIGAFLGTKHAARVMIPAKQGSIITTSSTCSIIGGGATYGYTVSKHGVVGLMKNTAVELGNYGIRYSSDSCYSHTDLSEVRRRFGLGEGVEIHLPLPGESADFRRPGWACLFDNPFLLGLVFPLPLLIHRFLAFNKLATCQVMPHAWRVLVSLCTLDENHQLNMGFGEFAALYTYQSLGHGLVTLRARDSKNIAIFLPPKVRDEEWFKRFVFVKISSITPTPDYLFDKWCLVAGISRGCSIFFYFSTHPPYLLFLSDLVQPAPTTDFAVLTKFFSLPPCERTFPLLLEGKIAGTSEDSLRVDSEEEEGIGEDVESEGKSHHTAGQNQEQPSMSSGTFLPPGWTSAIPSDIPPDLWALAASAARSSFSLDSVMERRKRKLTPPGSQSDPKRATGVTPKPAAVPSPASPQSPAHPRPPVPGTTNLLRFPRGYGGSSDSPLWPQLEQLLLPGPNRLLASQPLPELLSNAVEADFMSLQRSLFFKKEVARLMKKMNNFKGQNAALQAQLSDATGEKKAAQDQLALTQEIQRIKEFQAGQHLKWDLEEEERLFAEAFPSKPDLSILGDMEVSNGEEEAGCSQGPDATLESGAVSAEVTVPAGEETPAEWAIHTGWAAPVEGRAPADEGVLAEDVVPAGRDVPAAGDAGVPPDASLSAAD
ncbi:hypothetical protein KSS87_014700 [Heliosperma pusillum]|nr:hypothetical protein KSS87_014700 [Heliosperma pusillum]